MSREFQQSFYLQAFLLESEKLFQVAETRRTGVSASFIAVAALAFHTCPLSLLITPCHHPSAKARPSKCKVDGVPYLLLQVRRGSEAEDVFNALAAHPQVGDWTSDWARDMRSFVFCSNLPHGPLT